MKLITLPNTNKAENTKTWHSLKVGDFIYVRGLDDTQSNYAYISQITQELQDTCDNLPLWECTDIWDLTSSNFETEWTMEKDFFINQHKAFHKIKKEQFPEYFL